MNLLYRDILKQCYTLERQIMKNALTLAIHSPDDFAQHIVKKPRHMAVISEKVVHIIKCIPVEVKVQHTQKCFQLSIISIEGKRNTLFVASDTCTS